MLVLAFASILKSDQSLALRAKDMLMWVVNQAAVVGTRGTQPDTSAPFGSQFFSTFNRASAWGEGFGWVWPAVCGARACVRGRRLWGNTVGRRPQWSDQYVFF